MSKVSIDMDKLSNETRKEIENILEEEKRWDALKSINRIKWEPDSPLTSTRKKAIVEYLTTLWDEFINDEEVRETEIVSKLGECIKYLQDKWDIE